MGWVLIFFLLGVFGGAATVFVAFAEKRRRLNQQRREHEKQIKWVNESKIWISNREKELEQSAAELTTQEAEFQGRVVKYQELQEENGILKRDLQNIDVNLRKLRLDCRLQEQKQNEIDQRTGDLGSRYLKDNIKWIGSSLSANNYAACKKRLLEVIERCRGIGYEVSAEEEASLLADLKAEFEKNVRAALEREEQARIKAQIREEQRLQREVDSELKRLERERAAIQAALEKALAEAEDKHSEEIERLRARLAEAEERSRRAISQAQLTKAGHVYVLSNIGSFGERVFKIGMTRRLEPRDRVRELGDASVPFPFDVHMMLSCEDAPSLENALHRSLHKDRVNRVNPRKEFFRADIETIRQLVEENRGQVDYVANAEALEYRQSIEMSNEDAEYIEDVYASLDEEEEAIEEDV
ncbi:MAG: GIY-YIG nuclease family protein [Planctomycetes bacterium]|nr:GIY-YIG nuclease family protein [Planctomycetota bacterium]